MLNHRNLALKSPGETGISKKKPKRNLQRGTALRSKLTSLTRVRVFNGSDVLLPSLSSSSYSCQQLNSCSLCSLAFSAPLFLLRKTTLSQGRGHCRGPRSTRPPSPVTVGRDMTAPSVPRDEPSSSPQPTFTHGMCHH